jgi:hypothetical protein
MTCFIQFSFEEVVLVIGRRFFKVEFTKSQQELQVYFLSYGGVIAFYINPVKNQLIMPECDDLEITEEMIDSHPPEISLLFF